MLEIRNIWKTFYAGTPNEVRSLQGVNLSIEDGSFNEADKLTPRSPYSAAKAGSDLIALSYVTTHGLPVMVTRCSNNFGPYQYPEKVIPRFITQALSGQPLTIHGDGHASRDWLYVEDDAEAIVAIKDLCGEDPQPIDYSRVPWGIYCHPEVAFCGLTEDAARERGHDVVTSVHRWGGNSRALIVGDTEGVVKIVADRAGALLGVHIAGPWATELVAEAQLALNWDATASDVGGHRERIEDGGTGTRGAPDDPAAIARSLADMFADRAAWDERRRVARAFVERDRNWSSNIVRYEPVYQNLLTRSSRDRAAA